MCKKETRARWREKKKKKEAYVYGANEAEGRRYWEGYIFNFILDDLKIRKGRGRDYIETERNMDRKKVFYFYFYGRNKKDFLTHQVGESR